jgi:hypothetical protein
MSTRASYVRLAPILVVQLVVCASAVAQPTPQAEVEAARKLARQGLEALERHDFLEAEELLSRALTMHDAPTLHFRRAQARVALGRLLAAADDYRVARDWLDAPGEPPVFATTRKDAASELASLEPRIPQLTVEHAAAAASRSAGSSGPTLG